MRIILLMILALVFFLFCLGVINEPPSSRQMQSDQTPEAYRDIARTAQAGVVVSPNLPQYQSEVTDGAEVVPRDIAYASGYWVRWAQRDLGTILRRGAAGVYRFASGYSEANRRIRDSGESEYHDNSPPRADQVVAPSEGLESDRTIDQSDEVEEDVNQETRPQQRGRNLK